MVRWVRKGGEVEGDMREGEGVSGGGKGVSGDGGRERGENWNEEERKVHVERGRRVGRRRVTQGGKG